MTAGGAGPVPAPGAAAPPPPLPVHRTVLPNGLTVLVRADPGAPVVAIVTRVEAGYFDESDEDAGIAHVLEHMYFKGTPTRGVGEIARETKASGGYLNAHTIYDHTSYETVLPAGSLARGLEIQADAFANSLVDAGELARELEVIVQEARRKLDSPAAVAIESLYALLHDRHRIRRWRIGEEAGLRALTRERVLGFYRTWYRPRNTVLVVVGDVDPGDVLAQVAGLHGALPDEPVRWEPGTLEASAPGFRFREMEGDVAQAQVALGWRTPGPHDPDTPALDLAAAILADGRGSRLYRGVRERELATSVSAMNYTPRELGVFTMRAEGDAGRAAAAAAAMWAAVLALRDTPPSAFEVERAQRLFESRWLRRQEAMEGQADFLAEWEAQGGWEQAAAYYARMMSLTPADVHEAVRRHLDPGQASVLVYRPRGTPILDGAPDAVRRHLDDAAAAMAVPPAAPPPPVARPRHVRAVVADGRIGHVAVFRAASGLPILVRRRPGAPLVHLGLYTAGGSASEPDAASGVSTLMTRATLKGTADRTADAIASESEILGGSIGTSVTADGMGWTISVPMTRVPDALSLLQDVVQHPRFDEAAIETERAIALQQLAHLRDDMLRYPIRLVTEAAFEGHPYGRSLAETEASLRALRASTVRDWHARATLSSSAVAVAVGDVDEAAMAQALADAFSRIEPADARPLASPRWPSALSSRAEQRDKAQTALAIGFPAPARRDRSRYAVGLLAGIASGLGGRLFDELRDKRSLAYTVHAWLAERVGAGLFVVYIATDPAREEEARAALLAELARLQDEPVTADELRRAKRYAVGAHAIAQQRAGTVLGDVVDAWLLGEGLGELDAFEDRVNAVTEQEIQAFARDAFGPGHRVEGIVRGRAGAGR